MTNSGRCVLGLMVAPEFFDMFGVSRSWDAACRPRTSPVPLGWLFPPMVGIREGAQGSRMACSRALMRVCL